MNTPTALYKPSATATAVAALLTAAFVGPGPVLARDSIALIKRDEMINWLADRERGVWIQVGELKWFYARFADICPGLSSTNSLLFETPAAGHIGRTSTIFVPGAGRCMIRTVAPSSGPPETRNAGVVVQPQTQ